MIVDEPPHPPIGLSMDQVVVIARHQVPGVFRPPIEGPGLAMEFPVRGTVFNEYLVNPVFGVRRIEIAPHPVPGGAAEGAVDRRVAPGARAGVHQNLGVQVIGLVQEEPGDLETAHELFGHVLADGGEQHLGFDCGPVAQGKAQAMGRRLAAAAPRPFAAVLRHPVQPRPDQGPFQVAIGFADIQANRVRRTPSASGAWAMATYKQFIRQAPVLPDPIGPMIARTGARLAKNRAATGPGGV